MSESLTIVLPLPPRELSPNWKPGTRGSRMKAARLTAAYRAKARAAAESAEIAPPWDLARVSSRFYWPTRRRRDRANARGSIKAAVDGIVEAGVIVDDDSEHLDEGPIAFEIDRAAPRVEITVERV